MRKLVILNIGEGNFEQGFPVTIQIGEEGLPPQVAETGRLPALPDLPLAYERWQSSYDRLGLRSRIKARQVTARSLKSDCQQAAQQFCAQFNQWLRADSFRPIQDLWLQTLLPSDEIRVLLQTQDATLQHLPWHLWDVFTRYPHAEVGLSSPVFKPRSRARQPKSKVTILAVFGDSQGIDTQIDRMLLEQLPDAALTPLVEPTRRQLADALFAQPWDIFFFAGHSESPKDCGHIYLNPHDKLTIPELKHTLSQAVAAGLQLAILNSCDGMNPARDLADLQIPQTVFMREPVPDQVAQAFLQYFLAAFSQGDSLYLALRTARERLEALEDEFLYATWLPVIFQHPTAIPPTWHELRGVADAVPATVPPPIAKLRPKWQSRLAVVLTSAIATAGVLGVRHLGLLQPWELQAYDRLLQARSLIQPEPPDNRILVVEINDKDYAAQKARGENLGDKSLSDTSLIRLLNVLEKYQPRAIGLDLARDAAKLAPRQEVQRLSQSAVVYGACKGSNAADAVGFAPPAGIASDRIGFVDAPEDPDLSARRQILFMNQYPDSPCQASFALGTQLALAYLKPLGIEPQFTADKHLKLGQTEFKALQAAPGFYQSANLGGSQILLNYRPVDAQPVSLSDVLQDIPSLANAVRDRIVLVGVTRQDDPDEWHTPYTAIAAEKTPGVKIVAQQVSQILSAVLDKRPLLQPWDPWIEVVWLVGWAIGSGILIWKIGAPTYQITTILILVGLVWTISFSFFLQGRLLPLVPAILVVVITGSSLTLYQLRLHPDRPQKI